MALYSGIPEKVILQNNLTVPFRYFWKELMRDKGGYTIGRLIPGIWESTQKLREIPQIIMQS